MWAVRPVIAPQGMPAGVKLSRQSLASWRIGSSPCWSIVGVGVEGLDAPDRPALAVVVERLAGDGDRLGPVGRPRGHGEHQDLGARPEQGAEVALADAVDVGLVAVVAADRDAAAEVGRGADLAEVVVAAELAVGVAGEPAQQQVALDLVGVGRSGRGTSGPGAARRSTDGRPTRLRGSDRTSDRPILERRPRPIERDVRARISVRRRRRASRTPRRPSLSARQRVATADRGAVDCRGHGALGDRSLGDDGRSAPSSPGATSRRRRGAGRSGGRSRRPVRA